MIYLDSAATSLQKPKSVEMAVINAMKNMASPGRGGHRPAMLAADTALDCRLAAAKLFNMDEPDNVVFTFNATHALNIAIRSMVRPGDRVVVSGYEHNSVTRPVLSAGGNMIVAESSLFEPEAAVDAFKKAIPGAKCVVCCHVSNVFGYVLPIHEISQLCMENGVPLIIDASQSAGNIDIDFNSLGAEFIAMPGHKGLFGPQGTGLLLCRTIPEPLMSGGTGSNSAQAEMPDFLPDRLEAGTHNITGIAGLLAGIKYVMQKTPTAILKHEQELTSTLARGLERINGIRLYRTNDRSLQTGVLSVRFDAISCEEMAERLGKAGVAVRSGLHCSPTAHKTAGTMETGTVRFSVSPFNDAQGVRNAANITAKIVKSL